MTLLSIHAQREHSLITGERRRNPQHPLHRGIGAIHIGNQRIIVEAPRYHTEASLQAAEDKRIGEWNASKQQARPHECGALAMGDYCPHAVDMEPTATPEPKPTPTQPVVRRVA